MSDRGSAPHGALFDGLPYDYAAVAPGGALLFTAGACPLNAQGQLVGMGDYVEQARVVLDNLKAVLEQHGAGPDDLVKTTVYVAGDQDDLVMVWGVIAAGLAPHRPPSTLLGVTSLGYAGQLVEMEGIAALSDTPGGPSRPSPARLR